MNKGSTNPLSNPLVRYFLFGLVLTLLCTLVFIAGGWYSCKAGGGTLTKLTCKNVEVMGVCEDMAGMKYKIPNNYTPTTTPYIYVPK